MTAREALLGIAFRGANRINSASVDPPHVAVSTDGSQSIPLFSRFPALIGRIPYRRIGQFPTPLEELPLRDVSARLFVKRDDLSCTTYGGNKVRKLEFLIADAVSTNRRTLITMGGVGSNHALATAIHGRALGFDVDLVLYDQPPGPFVERNLGGFLAAGARLHHAGNTVRAFIAARRLFSRRVSEGASPYFIMVGGTCRLGCLGYVNAALELADQIDAGVMPCPDTVFVPLGTTGTAAGLVAGFMLAGLPTRVVAVRVADSIAANATMCSFFANDLIRHLKSIDSTVPDVRVGAADFDVLTDYLGKGYGHPTDAANAALDRLRPHLQLEPTYTAKALAACLDHCRQQTCAGNVLFWNTFSSAPVGVPSSWSDLPNSLRPFAGRSP